jgi:predicted lipid-binding transport protein (Tim44 family)
MVGMKDLLQIGLVAGVSYLAIRYFSKQKSATSSAPAASSSSTSSSTNEAAALEQFGEEGFAMELAQEQQLGASVSQETGVLDWNSADGWGDTTPISYGI